MIYFTPTPLFAGKPAPTGYAIPCGSRLACEAVSACASSTNTPPAVPASTRRAPALAKPKGTRKPRQIKIYKNPHSGEVVETKGGNHKVLKEWKAEYGSDEVESWLAQ
jgi:hypothetical protein